MGGEVSRPLLAIYSVSKKGHINYDECTILVRDVDR